jgi:lysine N6-hydroxylase
MTANDLDLVGIGVGPFNLGLAALVDGIPTLRAHFFERRAGFDWHPGMLIEGATLQVSFLADLVTLVDPTSRFSFLAYLKEIGRVYQFAIRDSSYVSRKEYTSYCRWVAAQLPTLTFGADVRSIDHDGERFVIDVGAQRVRSRNVVVGVGTVPSTPSCVPRDLRGLALHASDYLPRRDAILDRKAIVLVGSGQSAAEIFHDLVTRKAPSTSLTWLTRSPRFFPMDYSKLAVEMAAPDYIDHFYALAPSMKARVLDGQDALYKGINLSLIDAIYDLLYERTLDGDPGDVTLAAGCALEEVADASGGELRLRFLQQELERRFELRADALVLATGYRYRTPSCLEPLRRRLAWSGGELVVRRDYEVEGAVRGLFLQNAELHSHGFTAPDLSLGPYRNATILNAILGEERFALERRIAFQEFGIPRRARAATGGDVMSRPRAVAAEER